MRTPENIIDDAFRYIFVIFLGIPVTYFYNLLAGIIRSMGDSRTPVYFLIISAALNIVFDIISIKTLKMGVAGPASRHSALSSDFWGFMPDLYGEKI